MRKIVIAIDGFSSCGKSTMAKDLAREVGYIYVDTGAMYRSVTLYALRNNLFDEEGKVKEEELISKLDDINICFKLNEQTGRPDTYLNGERVEDLIRSLEVSQKVSPIAAIPAVREKLVKEQQKMGEDKGIVMDGRDIGTVVFPKAELKLFLTASPEVRAQRRYDELVSKGGHPDMEAVLADVNDRDYRDTHRAESPLRQADDAVVVDNSFMTREEQMELIIDLFNKTLDKLD